MTISQLFSPVLSNGFIVLFISLLLAACSTEENFTGSDTVDTGIGVTQGTTPEPILQPIPVPIVNLLASPSKIDSGKPATLSWSSTDADSCTASGSWSGARSTSGSQIVSPAVTSTYTLTCNSNGGSASDSVTVTVNQLQAPVPLTNLSVSSSSIAQGQSTTLSWSSTNANSCTASGSWGGTRNTSGSVSISPAVTSTYNLICNGDGGSVGDSVIVTVNDPPAPVPVVNLSVSASSIDKGQSVTLNWSSTDANSCVASGSWGGARNTTGTATVSPTVTSSYTLTCSGDGGSASDSIIVTVNEPSVQVYDINLSWIAPVEREDGTPISMSEIAGYRVYYGMSEGDYTNEVDISDRGTMQATLSDLLSGTYYIVVTTYDMEGRESSYSPVVITSL